MNKAARLNQELIFLGNKTEFRLRDLMCEFTISKRTALRDIEALGAMGLPYYSEPGRNGGYHLVNQVILTPIHFNLDEIRAIFFALNAMSSLSSNPFERSYTHIREKMLATLPALQQEVVAKMERFVYFYATAPVRQVTDLGVILQAILESKIVVGTNTQPRTAQKIHLQIYELFYRDGIWFCSAQDTERNRWETYRCDYLSNLSLEDPRADALSLGDLKKMQDTYEATYHNVPFRCALTPGGKEHFLRNHYPNMRLEENRDGIYLVGGYNQKELDYMAHYLLSYGKDMHVESPSQLRDAYRNLLKEILSPYENHAEQ